MNYRIIKIKSNLFYIEHRTNKNWVPVWKPFSNYQQAEKWLLTRNINDFELINLK